MTNRKMSLSKTPIEFANNFKKIVQQNEKSVSAIICVVIYDDDNIAHPYGLFHNKKRLRFAAATLTDWATNWADKIPYSKSQIAAAKLKIKQQIKKEGGRLSQYNSKDIHKAAIALLDAEA